MILPFLIKEGPNCIICNLGKAVGDATAYKILDTQYSYPSTLNECCRECLDDGLQQVSDDAKQSAYETAMSDSRYWSYGEM